MGHPVPAVAQPGDDTETSPSVYTTSWVSTLHAIFVAKLESASAFQNFIKLVQVTEEIGRN